MAEGVETMVGIEAASAELDRLMSEASSEPSAGGGEPASASDEQRAAQSTPEDDPALALLQPEAPAAAEPPEPAAQKQDDAPAATQQQPDGKSKFAKDKARRDDSWKALNAEKESFTKERETFQSERQKWQQEREATESSQRVTPEKYEAYAQQCRARVDHLKAEADRLDDAGKIDEADKLREEARDAEVDIKRATKAATDLRVNPQYQQAQAAEQSKRREWTLKAATDFPELAKDGSPFQQAVAQNLATLQQQFPEMGRLPSIIYFASRLTAAETASAGVSELKGKLSQAEARVKELEILTSPGAPGQPAKVGQTTFDQQPREEQLAELERMASGLMLR